MRRGPVERLTKDRVLAALDRSRWIVTVAARRLGASRAAVYLAIDRHGIDLNLAPPERIAAIRRRQSVGGVIGANMTNNRPAA